MAAPATRTASQRPIRATANGINKGADGGLALFERDDIGLNAGFLAVELALPVEGIPLN